VLVVDSQDGGLGSGDRRVAGFTHERAFEGETNVWLTPPDILEALGPFDLDPCAAPQPRPWPTARNHYVAEDDGLTQPWEGFVWLNPPYGPHVGRWLDRMAQHGSGIALVFARTETIWFQRSVCHAAGVLFPAKRIRFRRPSGEPDAGSASAPSCFLAYGEIAVERLSASTIAGFFVQPLPRKPVAIQCDLFGGA
jgi:hypothetical protein